MPRAFPMLHAAVLVLAGLLHVPLFGAPPVGTLEPPPVGFRELRILTPLMLEAFLVNTQGAGAEDRPSPWDFVDERAGTLRSSFPDASQIMVTRDGTPVKTAGAGFRRIPI